MATQTKKKSKPRKLKKPAIPEDWQESGARGKGGRPSLYDPKYCDEIIEYFDVPPYREIMTPFGLKRIPTPLPTLYGFAARIGVDVDTLKNWSENHDEFFGAVRRAKAIGAQILVTNGLLGGYNSRFATLAATNFTDMKPAQNDSPPPTAIIQVIRIPQRYEPAIGTNVLEGLPNREPISVIEHEPGNDSEAEGADDEYDGMESA